MGKEQRRKQLHYRRAEFHKDTGRTLQTMVEEAVRKLSPIRHRTESITDDAAGDSWTRFVNTHRSAMGMEFGALVLFSPGENRLIIDHNEDLDELDVAQLAAPGDNEFLESLLYYGLKDNHVIVLQSMAMRTRELEKHFQWLLQEAGVIGSENAVFLNNYAPEQVYDQLEKASVKSVRVGTPLIDKASNAPGSAPEVSAKAVRVKRRGLGLDLLRQLIPNRLDEIGMEALEDSSNIEVFVEVTYKRQTDDDSQALLNQITSALRHSSEEDVRIELKTGGVLTGSELRVKAYKSMIAYNGVLDLADVFDQMRAWLEELLSQQIIDADDSRKT